MPACIDLRCTILSTSQKLLSSAADHLFPHAFNSLFSGQFYCFLTFYNNHLHQHTDLTHKNEVLSSLKAFTNVT